MRIFEQKAKLLIGLKEKPFKLEKDIQNAIENNLDTIFGYKLVKSEFIIKSYRIDTLAFDEENKSFVIFEYKRDRNYSVVDQGVSYLNLMLEYKADFIVEYNESLKHNLKRGDVDWSQSKVIFIAPTFTDFQIQSSNFKDLPIELWECKRFENNVVVINPIKKSSSAPSISHVQSNSDSKLSKVAKEVKVYTEMDHLEDKSDEVKELYESFKTAILNLSPNIDVSATKLYIAFKKGRNITDIMIQKKGLKLWINLAKGKLDDPKKLTSDVSNVGHWGNGDYELKVENTDNIEYIMSLIKQAIE